MRSRWPILLSILALAGEAFAVEPAADRPSADAASGVPPDDVLLRRGAVIGEIYVETGDIFDAAREDEDKLLFRLANRLHVTTRPRVVERKLLFRRGDPYDPRVLRETERRLRSLDYLYDATVRPIRYRRGRVDVLVTTRDVWTLGMGAGFERSGGANTLRFNVDESNLLGTGRFLDVKYTDDPDRSSRRFRFVDDSLFGTRAELRLWYAANSDGHRRVFDLSRPFFALDSRWAAAAKVLTDDRRERIYRQGEITDRFQHERTYAEVRGGVSKGLVGDRARRWLFGYTYEEDRFSASVESAPETDIPVDRRLSYPWIGFEIVEDGFIETRNMDRISRTEDWNLGMELRGRLGFSSTAWGGDRDQAIFDLGVRSGFASRQRHTLLFSGHAAGRWGSEGTENVTVGGEVRYFLRNFGEHRLQVALSFDAAWNLDPERQLLLGGDSGLRGYPLRYQDGDRRFLLSAEQRLYTGWELFKLVHVGAAVFFDMGRAWTDDGSRPDRGVLTDAGLGLRLASSRSSKGRMVHLDVAFPLDGDDEIQWLVTSRETF